ncbi:outer membrane protein assembly factor BamB [Aquabacterium sp. J223]|uniref:outer membrane protein assembly factor BamB n=1 Tax=Aquabacterium sp. J223 TaxID=2898431 RepID=UPI0021ADF894|nr:outer membrane protein assembly factor BamB [Aquabacterium sp. J223]UUX97025.1 outer membrane protein assembly factor BamB [Aquabacterium sp. J223]
MSGRVCASATRRRAPAAALMAGLLLLGGCSSFNPLTWFGADKPKPAALEAVASPQNIVRPAWSLRLAAVDFALQPAEVQGRLFVAGGDGTVLALDAASGREQWRGSAGGKLSAGVGSDGRHVAVVTADGELVVLEVGQVRWRQRLASRVSTPPLVAGERVFVVGVDRVVHAFDALDGRRLWTFQRPTDALTLSQPGVLAAWQDTLLVGQGPRLVGLDPLRGSVRWEVPMASPRGTNEVERLADLVGPPVRLGDVFCARAFQSAVGCARADRGTLGWSRNVGGVQAIGGDEQLLFGADGSDRLSAWRTGSGEVAWTAERLLHRRLSAPVALPRAVAVGDFEGQLHLLSRDGGQTLQRLATDGTQVVHLARHSGGLLVVTRGGGLFSFAAE